MCAGGPPCNITTDARDPSEAEPGGVGRSGASRSSSGILRWADDRWVYPTSACIGGLPSIDIASLAEHCARAGNAESLLHAYVERKVSEQPSVIHMDTKLTWEHANRTTLLTGVVLALAPIATIVLSNHSRIGCDIQEHTGMFMYAEQGFCGTCTR